MKAYIIKVTYTEGMHTGHSYLRYKNGYIASGDRIFWADRCYKSLASAKAACTKLFKYNEMSREDERAYETIRIKRGYSPKESYIYIHETYEPYEVDAIE